MKIGLTTTSFRWDQGAERFAVNLTKALLHQGHELHIIGRLEKTGVLEEFKDRLTTDEKDRFFFHQVKTIKATKYLNLLTFAYAVHRVLKTVQLDVVQGFGKSLGLDVFRPPTGTHRVFISNKERRLNLEPCTYLEYAIEKKLLFEQAEVLVVNSQLSLKRVKQAYPDISIPCHVIPNIVDLKYWQEKQLSVERKAFREKWRISENDIVFLHVSTSFAAKGIPETLKAFQRVKCLFSTKTNAKIKLILVGDENFTLSKEFSEDVLIFPRIDDVRPYFRASDVLIHPTRFDSFANVTLEAFACGLPVITSVFNGAADIVEPDINGYIINSITEDEIVSAMMKLLKTDKRKRMSDAALKKSVQYSPERIATAYIDLYKGILPAVQRKTRNLGLQPWDFIGGFAQ